jgi:hypothetical protein
MSIRNPMAGKDGRQNALSFFPAFFIAARQDIRCVTLSPDLGIREDARCLHRIWSAAVNRHDAHRKQMAVLSKELRAPQVS